MGKCNPETFMSPSWVGYGTARRGGLEEAPNSIQQFRFRRGGKESFARDKTQPSKLGLGSRAATESVMSRKKFVGEDAEEEEEEEEEGA